MSPVLSVRDVSRSFAGRQVVADASFELHAGRITCLLGPSGCGKSTLLRMIAGLETVDAGEIALQGRQVTSPQGMVPPEHRGVGLVFQDFALFPHLNVADNVGFGLAGMEKAARQDRVMALLSRFHVAGLANAWPHMLSGGEQQRVAIARALAREPALLLLDEPFSGLDGRLRASVRQSVLADLREAGTAVLIVTHDPEEAMLIADELILMACGRILQTGNAEACYRHPVSIEAARLLGEVVSLPARVEAHIATTDFGTVPAPGMEDGPAQVLVRPEDFHLGAGGTPVSVLESSFGGAFQTITLSAGGASFTIRSADAAPAPGSSLGLSFEPAKASVFSA